MCDPGLILITIFFLLLMIVISNLTLCPEKLNRFNSDVLGLILRIKEIHFFEILDDLNCMIVCNDPKYSVLPRINGE